MNRKILHALRLRQRPDTSTMALYEYQADLGLPVELHT